MDDCLIWNRSSSRFVFSAVPHPSRRMRRFLRKMHFTPKGWCKLQSAVQFTFMGGRYRDYWIAFNGRNASEFPQSAFHQKKRTTFTWRQCHLLTKPIWAASPYLDYLFIPEKMLRECLVCVADAGLNMEEAQFHFPSWPWMGKYSIGGFVRQRMIKSDICHWFGTFVYLLLVFMFKCPIQAENQDKHDWKYLMFLIYGA